MRTLYNRAEIHVNTPYDLQEALNEYGTNKGWNIFQVELIKDARLMIDGHSKKDFTYFLYMKREEILEESFDL
jgi:hypothetical protein